jgi:hypothetical protein
MPSTVVAGVTADNAAGETPTVMPGGGINIALVRHLLSTTWISLETRGEISMSFNTAVNSFGSNLPSEAQ